MPEHKLCNAPALRRSILRLYFMVKAIEAWHRNKQQRYTSVHASTSTISMAVTPG